VQGVEPGESDAKLSQLASFWADLTPLSRSVSLQQLHELLR
jgi:hypothetical protein